MHALQQPPANAGPLERLLVEEHRVQAVVVASDNGTVSVGESVVFWDVSGGARALSVSRRVFLSGRQCGDYGARQPWLSELRASVFEAPHTGGVAAGSSGEASGAAAAVADDGGGGVGGAADASAPNAGTHTHANGALHRVVRVSLSADNSSTHCWGVLRVDVAADAAERRGSGGGGGGSSRLPRSLLQLDLSYTLLHAATTSLASHYLWPSHDMVLDWVVEPLSLNTKHFSVSVWTPRFRALDSAQGGARGWKRATSWMPSWPAAASLFDVRRPSVDGMRDGSMPTNTFATADERTVSALAIENVLQDGGVTGVTATAAVVTRSNRTPCPAWVRLHAVVQSVTWRHTKDIVADLSPSLNIDLAMGLLDSFQETLVPTPVPLGATANDTGVGDGSDASPHAGESARSHRQLSVADGAVTVAGDVSSISVTAEVMAAERERERQMRSTMQEHTWCWAMYMVEPGLLNSPWFLISPLSLLVPSLVPDDASSVVAALGGCVAVAVTVLFVAYMWMCALAREDQPHRWPLLLRFSTHAFPSGGITLDVALCSPPRPHEHVDELDECAAAAAAAAAGFPSGADSDDGVGSGVAELSTRGVSGWLRAATALSCPRRVLALLASAGLSPLTHAHSHRSPVPVTRSSSSPGTSSSGTAATRSPARGGGGGVSHCRPRRSTRGMGTELGLPPVGGGSTVPGAAAVATAATTVDGTSATTEALKPPRSPRRLCRSRYSGGGGATAAVLVGSGGSSVGNSPASCSGCGSTSSCSCAASPSGSAAAATSALGGSASAPLSSFRGSSGSGGGVVDLAMPPTQPRRSAASSVLSFATALLLVLLTTVPRPFKAAWALLCSRAALVFYVGACVWALLCVQSVVPVCSAAIGNGCPWRGVIFWLRLAVVVAAGPLPTAVVTIRFWQRFLFAPPGGLLRRYVLDRLGRVLVDVSGWLFLVMTWIVAVLLSATGVLHWRSAIFVFAIVFNSLVTLWFLFGHEELVASALRVFKPECGPFDVVCLVACVVLLAEPVVAAVVTSAYPGGVSVAAYLKLQTALGAALGILSRCIGVIFKIRDRANAYEKKVLDRQKQRRVTRFASI